VSTSDPHPIALVGLMGAGKSSVARLLGTRLGVEVADLDAMLEAEEGSSVVELFRRHGEAGFRERESRALERSLAGGARVVACGGGIVLDRSNRELLRTRFRTVWLEVSPEVAAARMRSEIETRPMLEGGPIRQRLTELLRERSALYAEVAAARILTDGMPAAAVAAAVLDVLGDPSK